MILKEDIYVRDAYGVRHRKYVKGQTVPKEVYDEYNSQVEVPEPVVPKVVVEEAPPVVEEAEEVVPEEVVEDEPVVEEKVEEPVKKTKKADKK